MLMQTGIVIESISAPSSAEKQAECVGQVKATVSQLGVGAEVMVMLKREPYVKGRVEGIEDENFLLAAKGDARPRRINYSQVSQISLAKLFYRAGGSPDATEVTRVVVAVGKDKQVDLVLANGKKRQGRIQDIEPDQFTLTDSRAGIAETIAYSSVTQIKGKSRFPSWGYVAIGAGAGTVVLLLILAAMRSD
jgi:ribosome maturation factor RimP